MKTIKLLIIFLLISGVNNGQTSDNKENHESDFKVEQDTGVIDYSNGPIDPYAFADEYAEFPGGLKKMSQFVEKNLKCPESFKAKKINGKCFVKFIVQENGSIKNIEIIQGVKDCAECDKEAIKVVKKMPYWKPAKINGKLVKNSFVLPVNFRVN